MPGASSAGDLGSFPGSGRSPGEGNGNPLQYSCLENPMDREALQATVHAVAKSQTRLSDFTFTFTSLWLSSDCIFKLYLILYVQVYAYMYSYICILFILLFIFIFLFAFARNYFCHSHFQMYHCRRVSYKQHLVALSSFLLSHD